MTRTCNWLRRQATDFYRAVHPLLGVTGSVERMADKKLRHYLRDVRDHLLLVDEEVAAQRDLLGTVLEANMAVISVEQTKISVRQNSTIEQLTILATIFLPLTFVTGFFGQNFGWLVAHIAGGAAFIAFGIGGLLVPLALLFSWLRLRTPSRIDRRRALPQLTAHEVPGRQQRRTPRPIPYPRPARPQRRQMARRGRPIRRAGVWRHSCRVGSTAQDDATGVLS